MVDDTGWNAFEDTEASTPREVSTVTSTVGHCEATTLIEGVTYRCTAIHQDKNEEHRAMAYDSNTGYAVKITWL